MIEDLQDELQSESPKKTQKPHRKGWLLFIAFLVWIIYASVMILSFLPKMIRAVESSGIVQILGNIDDLMLSSQTRDAKLCFAIPHSDGTSSFVLCNQRVPKTGASIYHDAIEGLLDGPGNEALSIGAISFIEKGTSLIGLTVSESTAFVNLSESFMSSGSMWHARGLDTAIKQITKTLQAIDPAIKKVVIMVDGSEITS